MEKMMKLTFLFFVIWILMVPSPNLPAQDLSQERDAEEVILVGRVAHVEGSLLRSVPEEGDWFQIVKDAPFGLEDKLRSENGSRAEIILPNNTWARIDGDTHIQLISLQNDRTEMHMVHGVARFYNKGSHSVITVTTPFGYVSAPAQTSFDLYVSETSVEVIALKGSVYFNRDADQVKAEVIESSTSLVADRYAVAAGKGYRDPDWEAWNLERDALWARRMRSGGSSTKHLPPSLHDHAYALDDYGVWERVYYDGAYGYLWRPIYVSAGWAPFTVGSWTLWYGDHVWIPCEPFGYATHHYGSWVHVGGYWYWAPPVTSVSVHFGHPAPSIGFAWYPGRVRWFHFGVNVGWIPLAPHEPYYCHRHWGPRAIVVKNVNAVKVNIQKCKNVAHAVAVNRGHLHATDNYRRMRIKNVDHRRIENKHAPVLLADQKRAGGDKQKEKHAFKSVATGRKFRGNIATGIKHDPFIATSEKRVRGGTIGGKKKDSNPGAIKRESTAPSKTRQEVFRGPEATGGYSEGRFKPEDSKTKGKSLPALARSPRKDSRNHRNPRETLTVSRKGLSHSKAPVSGRLQKPPKERRARPRK